jgi:hypothetical protein
MPIPEQPYATVTDLTAPGRFPRALTEAELASAPTMLADASFLLSVKVPGLAAAVTAEAETGEDGPITQAAMLMTVAMVRRALLAQASQQNTNPAVDSLSEAWGPFNRSIKYRSDDGNLYLYDREVEYLEDLLRGSNAEAVSMRSRGL